MTQPSARRKPLKRSARRKPLKRSARRKPLKRSARRKPLKRSARRKRLERIGNRIGTWVTFLVALAVLGIGVRLLFIDWHGKPVAADFTRVGGLTRVETAVHVSHLWVTPPRYFVTTPAYADQQTMLWAAQTAMAHDAPLLFTSRNGKRPRLVRTTIHNWRSDAERSRHPYHPKWINVVGPPSGREQCPVYKHGQQCPVKQCPVYENLAASARLSTLTASNHLLPCSLPVARPDTLAPVVVFAVARRFPVASGSAYPPDVAVGLSLAAHLAAHMSTPSPKVSLVVVPRGYLEADPQLEQQLRDQRGIIQGGVVLGSTRILADGTQVLLRQILTAADQQTLLGQLQADLGAVGPVVAALLALLGLGALAQTGPKVIPEAIEAASKIGGTAAQAIQNIGGPVAQAIRRIAGSAAHTIRRIAGSAAQAIRRIIRREPPGGGDKGNQMTVPNGEPTTPARGDWLTSLDKYKDQKVTVWLSSGWTVNGTVKDQDKATTVLRINEADLTAPNQPGTQLKRTNSEPFVLVPVKDIAFITYGFKS